jgi:hypothetical protein
MEAALPLGSLSRVNGHRPGRLTVDSERVEELLERIADQGDAAVETLREISEALADMRSELDWAGELSFAKELLDRLDRIEAEIQTLRP